MKILVLGGAGLMATGGVSYLKDYDNVSSIVMTDINLEAVDAVAAALASDKISTDTLDVLNRDALINYAKILMWS